ncbi:MAG: twin-arginine translocase TatA/TatE family subunit [Muribaculaceae bacterium]|nr:twin-arginine translocase TatA/TatE family subunit [Muribaculaceae bacterium]
MKGWQLIIVILLIILLFGANRIPSIMKNLGKSVHSFKQGVAEAEAEMKKPVKVEKDDTEAKDKDKE